MTIQKIKVDFKCRVFKKNGKNSIFVEANDGTASCLICNESVDVLKECNLRRHYKTKHLPKYSKFTGSYAQKNFN